MTDQAQHNPTYLFGSAEEIESRRLSALSAQFDPISTAILEGLEIGPDARCLEIGAGDGSIARWMSSITGPAGDVLVTDIDPRYFEELSSTGISVELRDVAINPPDRSDRDLIHARTVLEHISGRDRIVPELAAGLRPGGWLVLEDISVGGGMTQASRAATFPSSDSELHARTNEAMATAYRAVGADPEYGTRLPAALREAGLVEVGAALNCVLVNGGTRAAEFYVLSLQLAADRLVAAGLLTRPDVDRHLRFLIDPQSQWLSLALVSAWGRRPR